MWEQLGRTECIILIAVFFSPFVLFFLIVGSFWAGQQKPAEESKLLECPDCGQHVSRRATKCPHCGCPIVAEHEQLQPCEACNQSIAVTARSCPICGHPRKGANG